MALHGTGSSTKYWTAPLTWAQGNKPLTIAYWFNDGGDTTSVAVLGLAGTAAYVNSTYYNHNSYIKEGDDSSTTSQSSIGSMPSATWYPIVLIFRAASSRTLYAGPNFATVTDSTTSLSTQTLTTLDIGWALGIPSVAGPTANQAYAEVAIWGAELGLPEVRMFSSGVSPLLIRPASLLAYFPLRSDVLDYGPMRLRLVQNAAFVPVWAPHPLLQPFPFKRRVLKASSVVAPPRRVIGQGIGGPLPLHLVAGIEPQQGLPGIAGKVV